MKKSILSIMSAIVACSTLATFQVQPLLATIHRDVSGPPVPPEIYQSENLPNDDLQPLDTSGPSCANPSSGQVQKCDEWERRILASTVRLEWHVWSENDDGSGYTPVDAYAGHATIKDGRYLVTHNHSGISLSDPENGVLTTVSVFAANGKPIWLEAPLELVTVAAEDAQTLVLDFGSYSGEGLFATFGLSSPEFRTWESLPLRAGMEVAQIDWNGATAHIDWVTIDAVTGESGTPRLELANAVLPGASGGGVFWNGNHIANTWSRVTTYNVNSGAIVRRYSEAALNSSRVVAELP